MNSFTETLIRTIQRAQFIRLVAASCFQVHIVNGQQLCLLKAKQPMSPDLHQLSI